MTAAIDGFLMSLVGGDLDSKLDALNAEWKRTAAQAELLERKVSIVTSLRDLSPLLPEVIRVPHRNRVPHRDRAPLHAPGRGMRFVDVEHCGIRMTMRMATRWPAERIAIIRRDYEGGRPIADMLHDLNTIAGEPIDAKKLGNFAFHRLGLRRPYSEGWKPPETTAIEPSAPVEPAPEPKVVHLAQKDDWAQRPTHPVPPPEARVAFSMIAPAPKPRLVKTVPQALPPNLGPPKLARALEMPVVPPVTLEPIEADFGTIKTMANLWGCLFRDEGDLNSLNGAAIRRGARPFRLVETKRRRRCLKCPKTFDDEGLDLPFCPSCRRKTA